MATKEVRGRSSLDGSCDHTSFSGSYYGGRGGYTCICQVLQVRHQLDVVPHLVDEVQLLQIAPHFATAHHQHNIISCPYAKRSRAATEISARTRENKTIVSSSVITHCKVWCSSPVGYGHPVATWAPASNGCPSRRRSRWSAPTRAATRQHDHLNLRTGFPQKTTNNYYHMCTSYHSCHMHTCMYVCTRTYINAMF